MLLTCYCYYASPSSGEAYRDRRLTINFELRVEVFCMPTCFHVRIPKPCLSVCPSICPSVCLSAPREKKSSKLRQYQSYKLIDTSMERSSRVLYPMETQKFDFFFQKSLKFDF